MKVSKSFKVAMEPFDSRHVYGFIPVGPSVGTSIELYNQQLIKITDKHNMFSLNYASKQLQWKLMGISHTSVY